MRVYVIEGSGKGGMIQYDYHLCRALQRSGIETVLVTSTQYELHDLPHEFRVVKLLKLWDPRGGRPANPLVRKIRRVARGLQYGVEWLRLIAFLLREHPDVILFGEVRFHFEYYFLLLLRGLGFRLAAVVHDVLRYDYTSNSDAITRQSQHDIHAYTRIYRQFFALFVHDRTNTDLFLHTYSIPKETVHEIHHATSEISLEIEPALTPLELRAQLGIPPEQPVVLFFGTITKYKGLDILLQAFPKVVAATKACLLVAGFPAKDVDPEELKRLVAELNISDAVSWFLDYVPNNLISPLLQLSSVVVLPYRMIAQSGVLQIAYAYGKPVVATR
ncbi:MAG: glycosyltransferase, partial [Chloroflexota bacterium]